MKKVLIFFAAVSVFLNAGCRKNQNQTASVENEKQLCVEVSLEGGSGKAKLVSPADVISENGRNSVTLVFKSRNYDYVIADGEKYLKSDDADSAFSTFTIPVKNLEEPLSFTADTLAMGTPHEIQYVVHFGEVKEKENADFSTSLRSGRNDNDALRLRSGIGSSTRSMAESELSSVARKATHTENEANSFVLPAFISVDSEKIKKTSEVNFKYADQIKIGKYDGYQLVMVKNGENYLVVPENEISPEKTDGNFLILKRPFNRTYLVSTSSMDYVAKINAIDFLKFSSLKQNDWFVPEAVEAMKNGKLAFAGKYSAPDYELLASEKCNLAIESMMILHKPEAKEKLEELGIPVFIERESNEKNPLGRLEWIKLFGIFYERENEADEYFESEIAKISPILNQKQTGKTVAFFNFSSNGSVTIRRPGDYISTMISFAGGKYVPDFKQNDENSLSAVNSTMNIQIEDFYADCINADILIYNGTIEGELSDMNALLSKKAVLGDFDAVKNERVYCVSKELYQKVTGIADFIEDVNKVLNDDENGLVFLKKLKK